MTVVPSVNQGVSQIITAGHRLVVYCSTLITNPNQVNVSVSQKFLVWLDQQSYYEVHGGAVESQSYVGEGLRKRNDFKRWRKTGRDGDDWMSDGSEFQTSDAVTGNVRRPTVMILNDGTDS